MTVSNNVSLGALYGTLRYWGSPKNGISLCGVINTNCGILKCCNQFNSRGAVTKVMMELGKKKFLFCLREASFIPGKKMFHCFAQGIY